MTIMKKLVLLLFFLGLVLAVPRSAPACPS
jgi:hypothetical protein